MNNHEDKYLIDEKVIGAGLWLILLVLQFVLIYKIEMTSRRIDDRLSILQESATERFGLMSDKLSDIRSTITTYDLHLEANELEK